MVCPALTHKAPLSPAPAPSHTPCILAGRGGLDSPLTPEAWAPETPLLLCDLAVTGHLPGVLCSFRPTCILSPYHIWPSSQAGPLVPSPTASLYPPTSQNCDSERPGQAVLSLGASGQAKSRAFQRTQGNPELVLKPKMRHVTSMSELVPSCYSPLDGDIPPHMETVSMATYQHQFKVPFKLLQVNTNSSFLLLSVYYLNLNCSNYFSF